MLRYHDCVRVSARVSCACMRWHIVNLIVNFLFVVCEIKRFASPFNLSIFTMQFLNPSPSWWKAEELRNPWILAAKDPGPGPQWGGPWGYCAMCQRWDTVGSDSHTSGKRHQTRVCDPTYWGPTSLQLPSHLVPYDWGCAAGPPPHSSAAAGPAPPPPSSAAAGPAPAAGPADPPSSAAALPAGPADMDEPPGPPPGPAPEYQEPVPAPPPPDTPLLSDLWMEYEAGFFTLDGFEDPDLRSGFYEGRQVTVEGLERDIFLNGRTGTVVKWKNPQQVLVEIDGRQGWTQANRLRLAAGRWRSTAPPAG